MTHFVSTLPTPGGAASRLAAGGLSTARFVLHFVEMLLAMYVGMLVFMAVPGAMALPSALHQLGMALAMSVPMVAWMRIRGHGWRHGFEMAAGMLLPWAAVLGLVAVGAARVLPWLEGAADPAMLLGMLGVMLVRRDHSAHAPAHQHAARHADGQRVPRMPWRRVRLAGAYLGAIVLVPLLIGAANIGAKAIAPRELAAPPAHTGALPAPPTPDPNKKIAVVLSGFEGAEIGDTLEAFEVLARSGMFNVYSIAPQRTVLPLRTGPVPWGNSIDFAPHFSFAEYDTQVGRQPDLIVLPYFQADPTSPRDAVIFDWIRARFGPNTMILGICSGNMVLADTGLVAGRTATTNNGTFEYVESSSPTTTWLRNLRYVDDGNIVTSSNLAAGIDATLHVVDRLAGRATALEVARQIGYTQTGALDDPRFVPPTESWLSNASPLLFAAAFEGPVQRMGVLVYDGVTELGVSGIVDPLEGSLSTRTFFMAPQPGIVRSRDGFLFVPRYTSANAPALDRVVVAAGDNGPAREQVLTAWSGRPVEEIYQNVGAGETAYDASLRHLARTRSGIVARGIANGLFYTAAPRDFAEASWLPGEVVVILALMLLGAAGVHPLLRARAS